MRHVKNILWSSWSFQDEVEPRPFGGRQADRRRTAAVRLCSPDRVGDESVPLDTHRQHPCLAMVQRMGSGAEDGDLVGLGDEMALRLKDPEIQVRTFAALILAEVVERDMASGRATAEAVLRWRDAFAAWYPAERDLRGWDERLGWLHAVAHGADALAAFGRSPRLGRDDLRGLSAVKGRAKGAAGRADGAGDARAQPVGWDRGPHAVPLLGVPGFEPASFGEAQLRGEAHRAGVGGLGLEHHRLAGKLAREPAKCRRARLGGIPESPRLRQEHVTDLGLPGTVLRCPPDNHLADHGSVEIDDEKARELQATRAPGPSLPPS